MIVFGYYAGGCSSTTLHTRDGGKVHITSTVIGDNGSGQREKKFRTLSSSLVEDEKRQKARNRSKIKHDKPMTSSLSPERSNGLAPQRKDECYESQTKPKNNCNKPILEEAPLLQNSFGENKHDQRASR